jgi:hypothetical protein
VSIDDYADVPENNETALVQAVSVQPVSIAIEASGRDFQHYVTVSLLPPPPKTLISLPLNPSSLFPCCNEIWISW